MNEEMMCEDCRKELEDQKRYWYNGDEMVVTCPVTESSCGKCDDKVNSIEPIDLEYYQDIAKNMNLVCGELRVELMDLVEESRIYMNRVKYELQKINELIK